MNRRQFIFTSFKGSIGLGLSSALPTNNRTGAKRSSRPNIILIMSDDMGYSDIGCYGGEIATPNIDSLARGGLRFNQFYNASRCCPTRASLLTGLFPHQAGMGGMVHTPVKSKAGAYQGYLNNQCVTIAEVLQKSGYNTLMSGKWHVGETRPHWPLDRGFNKYFGLISGAANYFDISKTKNKRAHRQMVNNNESFTPPEKGFYMTDAITDHAVEMLDQACQKDKPFFLYTAYTAPHWPLHALPEDIAKYKDKYLQGWDVLRKKRFKRQQELGIAEESWKLSPLDEEVTPWNELTNKEEMALKMAVYAAQIDRMDQGIGKILARLKESGQEDNTLIFFLSDNGGCHEGGPQGLDFRKNGLPPGGVDSYMSYGRSWANASNTPFRMFKHWVHEGGISTPLIVRWPRMIKNNGRITSQTGHIIDLMATCLDAAGAEYPLEYHGRSITPLQGKSLLPVFRGKVRNEHEYLFWEHEGNKAVRHKKWKLVSKKGKHWELYDLTKDRTELVDLSAIFPDIAALLKQKYFSWAQSSGVQ